MVRNIVLITNEINPYRKSFYDKLFEYCKTINIRFTVLLMTKVEHGYNWDYNKVKSDYAILMKGHHFSFPINNHLNWEVRKYIEQIKPEIVIMAGSYFYYTNWIAITYKKKYKFPIYFWSETHFNEKRKYSTIKFAIREWFRRNIYRHFDGFWYSGKLSKEFIEHYAKPNVKLHFVPNLVDNQFYYNNSQRLKPHRDELRKKWNIPQNNRVIITPARLVWVKGLHTFIDLLSNIEDTDNLTMLIPGVGDYKDIIEKKIKESKLDIRLLGYQQQNTVVELYSLSDFFVMPSLSDPNPLTCIEALWCGLPMLVSSHVGNYPEAIKQGFNGYVFDYAKHDEAIEIITKFLSSDIQWQKTASDQSLKIAQEYYDPNKVVIRLIDDMIAEIKIR